MGDFFLGPDELRPLSKVLGLPAFSRIPPIPFPEEELELRRRDSLLILGAARDKNLQPLTLSLIKQAFGDDAEASEPCFYPQDWYQRERFATHATPTSKWHLIRREVEPASRGKDPMFLEQNLPRTSRLPAAVFSAYVFFAYYLHTKGTVLWANDFVWCADRDSNGDRIYVGRYEDPSGLSRRGFSVHRHLSIRSCYGVAAVQRH